jgi:hypothetical protein
MDLGTLLTKFFRVYHQWSWPNPILLNHATNEVHTTTHYPSSSSLSLDPHRQHLHYGISLESWNPKVNPRDRMHLMPIITPAFPAMNSSYNVLESTMAMMQHEFRVAATICVDIEIQVRFMIVEDLSICCTDDTRRIINTHIYSYTYLYRYIYLSIFIY